MPLHGDRPRWMGDRRDGEAHLLAGRWGKGTHSPMIGSSGLACPSRAGSTYYQTFLCKFWGVT